MKKLVYNSLFVWKYLSLFWVFILFSLSFSSAQTYTALVGDKTFANNGLAVIDLMQDGESVRSVLMLEDGSMILLTKVQNEILKHETRVYRILPSGEKDKEFNQGVGYFSFSKYVNNIPSSMVMDKDGKILILIRMGFEELSNYPVLIKLNQDGTLVTSYEGGGYQYIWHVHDDDRNGSKTDVEIRLTGIVKDKNDDFFLGGFYRYNREQFRSVVLKLNADGIIDTSFGEDGFYEVPTDVREETPNAILFDGSSAIYLLGNTDRGAEVNAYRTYMVSRIIDLQGKGVKDTLFNDGGNANFNIGLNGLKDYITDGTLDNQGKVVSICQYFSGPSGRNQAVLARVDTSGYLDSTFNKKGYWINNFGAVESSLSKIKIDKMDRIWCVGSIAMKDGQAKAAIIRLTNKGLIDSTFGENGVYTMEGVKYASFSDFILTDTTITVLGHSDYFSSTSNSKLILAKFRIEVGDRVRPVYTSLVPRGYNCLSSGQSLPLISSSNGKMHWEILSGPARISHDSVHVYGRGIVAFHLWQESLGKFTQVDTTWEVPTLCDLVVYQYLTPNDDGYNDKLHIQNIEFFPNSKVTVVNKWQEEVYTSTGYQNTWQPSHLQNGTYYYIVQTGFENETYKGILFLENK